MSKSIDSIDVTVGIYDTEYSLIKRRDGKGTLAVKRPYIRWDKNNNGNLAFEIVDILDDDLATVTAFFDAGELVLDANNECGVLTLDDVLDGRRAPGVEVAA